MSHDLVKRIIRMMHEDECHCGNCADCTISKQTKALAIAVEALGSIKEWDNEPDGGFFAEISSKALAQIEEMIK